MYSRLRVIFTLFFISLFTLVQAQQSQKLTGKVLNDKNEPLAGVTIKIVGGGGATTDLEGRFSLSLIPGKKYQLEFSAVGYAPKTISDAEVTAGQANELNINLEIQAKTGDAVVVTAKTTTARRESVAAVIAFQKNTNTVASVISAESIRRSPDKTTGEVLKRTPGASIVDGKFVVVRGLADRYNQAMLNGILLTSTEPDRKTFSFDLIPSAMIDNVVINKAFVPELPGEWAGGLIQVNTKDIPAKNFLNVQVGTSLNTQTNGKPFFEDPQGGKKDWLGTDDGTRALPQLYTTKSGFDQLTPAEKTNIGKQLRSNWKPREIDVPVNLNFQANGGFTGKFLGKNVGGAFGIVYNRTNRYLKLKNRGVAVDNANNIFVYTDFNDDKYEQDVLAGALASLSLQINPLNKISVKSILNINTANSTISREGPNISQNRDIRGTEITFRQNTFFTVQLTGEHSIAQPLRLKWYGAFNILDGYTPDQRRLQYFRNLGTQDPFQVNISNTLSQVSGSRIYQNLSDYIYTAGGDLAYAFNWLGQKQTLKGGYMLQIKDRLYDAQLFANYLPTDNAQLRSLPADQVFLPGNFGNGAPGSNMFAFDAIKGNSFRYMANTILNAGFLQMDNQFTRTLRVVYGLRVENYDQLVGSVKKYDDRHTYTKVTDFLPGVNATLKLNQKTNLRLTGSQTVVRPELRELAKLNLYDFELNASIQGYPPLKRTKVSNFDVRYEVYPRAGELFTFGVFYKHFENAIQQIINNASADGSGTFEFRNADKARDFGVEFEMRKKLDFSSALKNFTFQANLAYINSIVKDAKLDVEKPLQGQSPYTINLGLMYDLEKQGINATILFNRIGERIYIVGDVGASLADIWEAPRNVLDFQFAKKMIRNTAEIKLGISDILNTTQNFYLNANGKDSYQKSVDPVRFSRKYGTTFSATFSYSF